MLKHLHLKISVLSLFMAVLGSTFIMFAAADLKQALPMLGAMLLCSALLIIVQYVSLSDLRALTARLESLSQGQLDGATLPEGTDDLGRIGRAINTLERRLKMTQRRVDTLAQHGRSVDSTQALAIQRLAEVNIAPGVDEHEPERSVTRLENHVAQAIAQLRILGTGHLQHAALDERVPGELGNATWRLMLYLRQMLAVTQGTREVSEEDGELALALIQSRGDVDVILEQITQVTLEMNTSAEEIMDVLHDQTLSASHQASGVEETQRTMETLLSSAKKIAESAQTVFKSAERTQANNRLIADRANDLKSHTERIGEILETIKTIADRSDLLALNASLEGLRAGEAGKGFTLVANEMRRLAENIKGSVVDVKALLDDIRESALKNVLAIDEGSRLSERTTESALKISLITQQQQSGTEQVTQSMEDLSHLINQGLAGTEQVTSAATQLSNMAESMRMFMDAQYSPARTAPTRAPMTRRVLNPRATPTHPKRITQPNKAISPSASQPTRLVMTPKLSIPTNPELNATMRFSLGDIDETVVGMVAPSSQSPAHVPEHDNIAELFDSVSGPHQGAADESIEETFDAIERELAKQNDQRPEET